jgi:hypothetical protein
MKILTYIILLHLTPFVWIDSMQARERNGFRIQGTVADSVDSEPMADALISISQLNVWVRSDANGRFELHNVPAGIHDFQIYQLGYKERMIRKEVYADINDWNIQLQELSLGLDEVTVVAVEHKQGSVSKIQSEAIEHLQPKSMADIFQLLPGHVTENPTLAQPEQIRIREITTNTGSAAGTLMIVDGAPVSNDVNMQRFNSAQSGNSSSAATTIGGGTDLRGLSAENIESVEVIKGIPSSEYGNLTSGAVLIKTKKGDQPWTVKGKIDPNTKMGSVYKGFRLSPRQGVLNAGIDYAQATDDIRYKYRGYQRLTGNVGYSNTFNKTGSPLNFEFNLSGFRTMDEDKSDPQLKQEEKIKASHEGFRLGINGKWMLSKPWITNLEYSISGDYAAMENYAKELLVLSTGAVPYPTSYRDGVFEEKYLPGVYYTEYRTRGKPFNFFAKVKAQQSKQFGETVNTLLAGVDLSMSGNRGEGLTYDLSTPPMRTIASSSRPRAYKDIPRLKNYAFFLEDKVIQPIGSTRLIAQAGVRFSGVQPGNLSSTEPRLNVSYEILNSGNNAFFDNLSVHFGYGIACKMPGLSYLSPDYAYIDNVSLNYLDGDHSLAVVTTKALDTTNENLKAAGSRKREVGLSFGIKGISVSLTAYDEKTTNGLSFVSTPYVATFTKFAVEGAGKMPEFDDGQVYYYENGKRIAATSVDERIWHMYYSPTNNQVLIKKGLEYIITTGQIKALQTSFVFDGAWMQQENYNENTTYKEITSTYQGKLYPYVAVMPARNRTVLQRTNTNVRMITHIPELKMVVTLTGQFVWSTKSKIRWEDENGRSLVYYEDENGNRLYGDEALNDTEKTRYVDPVAFIDEAGVRHEWQEAYSQMTPYSFMVSNYNTSYYFVEERLPAAVQFNIRLTKEFSQSLSLSFMANNFLKMHPSHRSNRTSLYVRRNTDFYFGAELNYKF